MTEEVDKKQQIIDAYLGHISENGTVPTRAELLEKGIKNDSVRNVFGNLMKLHEFMEENYNEQIGKYVTTQAHVFSERNLKNLDESLAKYQRFVITTAVSGKKVDKNFLKTIKSYCEQFDAKLLLIPCADIANRYKDAPWSFDENIRDEVFITEEARLNDSIFISNIHLSAKQIKPTTGLARIAQRNGSVIFASPKQFLKYASTSPAKERMPKAIMTPGAITVADYSTDKYMSQRISYIAENDHVMGAVIVEIVDQTFFHFRQIQAAKDGSFADLGRRFYPTGESKQEKTHFYAGDWHSGETDWTVADAALKMCDELDVQDFYTGDFFTGRSITHHNEGKPLKKAIVAKAGLNYLEEELLGGVYDMSLILTHIGGTLYLIKGNHDEVLERYLNESRFVKDPQNYYAALSMAKDLMDGKDPLESGYKSNSRVTPEMWDRVYFLQRDEEQRVGPVECGQHGDLGPNGGAASLENLEEAYGECIVGHTHSAAIFRGVFRVGTFTKLHLDYNTGPSSWTHTGCLVYPDGSRQLVNFINGDYRLR